MNGVLGLHSYRVPRNLYDMTIIIFSKQCWESLVDTPNSQLLVRQQLMKNHLVKFHPLAMGECPLNCGPQLKLQDLSVYR